MHIFNKYKKNINTCLINHNHSINICLTKTKKKQKTKTPKEKTKKKKKYIIMFIDYLLFVYILI